MHDRNGKKLEVEDIVNIPCKVKTLQPSEDYCNVDVETLYCMPPYTTPHQISVINTKQIIKVEGVIGSDGKFYSKEDENIPE